MSSSRVSMSDLLHARLRSNLLSLCVRTLRNRGNKTANVNKTLIFQVSNTWDYAGEVLPSLSALEEQVAHGVAVVSHPVRHFERLITTSIIRFHFNSSELLKKIPIKSANFDPDFTLPFRGEFLRLRELLLGLINLKRLSSSL